MTMPIPLRPTDGWTRESSARRRRRRAEFAAAHDADAPEPSFGAPPGDVAAGNEFPAAYPGDDRIARTRVDLSQRARGAGVDNDGWPCLPFAER
jgi:hypothetical protein